MYIARVECILCVGKFKFILAVEKMQRIQTTLEWSFYIGSTMSNLGKKEIHSQIYVQSVESAKIKQGRSNQY